MSINVKKYLMQVFNIDRDILSRMREKETLRHSYLKAAVILPDKVQESNCDRHDEKYMKLFDIGDHIETKIAEVCNLRKRISDEIDKVQDVDSRTILRDRYLNGLSWEEIASVCNYSTRNVTRIHGRALQEFYEINKKSVDNYKDVLTCP